MRVLLIDNGTRYLPELHRLLENDDVETVAWSSVPLEGDHAYDCCVLSGGHTFPVVGHETQLAREFLLVQTITVPVLGICFGFEIIARAFGALLVEQQASERGMLDIEPLQQHPIFSGLRTFRVFENHRWVVQWLPDDLVGLARSRDGFEIVQHRDRPIIGFQFHPEMFPERSDGDDLFRNLFSMWRSRA